MQRKTFRIEAMLGRTRVPLAPAKVAAAAAQPSSADVKRLERELAAICDAIERNRQELTALAGGGVEGQRIARAGQELGAAVNGMEKATEKILKATEAADEGARALVATLQDDYKRGVAQDIQDHLVRIYEACNFQDLAGQRISKVAATLKFIEERVARLSESWGGIERLRRIAADAPDSGRLINGPRLEGDVGHASQHEIDRLFAKS